jgi:hypothetical protein
MAPQRRDGRANTDRRAEEAADIQRRLKQEAAERREVAAGKSRPAERRHAGPPPGQGRSSERD